MSHRHPARPPIHRRMRDLACLILPALLAASPLTCPAADFWDMQPILYSDTPATDPISALATDLASGKQKLKGTDLEKLTTVLRLLDIPVESQVLVFSKTSHQNKLIHPGNPRALYFNENAYVGYVPGGSIEVITHDPLLGVVFHLIHPAQSDPARIVERDNSVCLACHGTRQTENVPGLLVRSVHPDENGHLLLALGTSLIDSRSPIPQRWGGYYVTGISSLPHLGNRTYGESSIRGAVPVPTQLDDVSGKTDVRKYPRATSDVVALMVLEHQCRMHNLLIAASLEYRRAVWMARSLDPDADPDQGNAARLADDHALRIADALLFKDETDMGPAGIDGDAAFQDAFARRHPRAADGSSLADFHLGKRLFKNRCSYMIHSRAFTVLPPRVKSAVFKRLHEVLEQGQHSPEMPPALRQRTAAILKETVPGW